MIEKITRNTHYWLPAYFAGFPQRLRDKSVKGRKHIFLAICDHFEPLWNNADYERGLQRVRQWVTKYPLIAQKFRDADGKLPKYTFFFPEEEYRPEYLELLSDVCHREYGEVEIHLHHRDDEGEHLRSTILNFKEILFKKHGLLSKDKITGQIGYGFIHGNWALDNSHPEGKFCGVNNELDVLRESGCFADFTMPSAPDATQTAKINSIYYAIDDPLKSKSHNHGLNAEKGINSREGLLMVQGPLMLNWSDRKCGLLPRIENGALTYDQPVSPDRIKLWLDAHVHVKEMANCSFVKLYTHGCQEMNSDYLLGDGLADLFSCFQRYVDIEKDCSVHYVSAREMVNIIKSIEDAKFNEDLNGLRDYRFAR
jgi:hypothetical protein